MELKDSINGETVLWTVAAVGLLLILVDSGLTSHSSDAYNAKINVTPEENSSRVDLGLSAGGNMDFGEVPTGTNVTKKIKLDSTGRGLVTAHSTGNISEYIRHDRRLALKGGERIMEVEVVPSKPGYFQGQFKIKIQTANNTLGRRWLELKSYFY